MAGGGKIGVTFEVKLLELSVAGAGGLVLAAWEGGLVGT